MSGAPAGTLRTGHSAFRTLYIKTPYGEEFIGHAKSREIADQAVNAVNTGEHVPGARWWSSGCLVFTHPGAQISADWEISVDDPAVAWAIVAAVNGVTT